MAVHTFGTKGAVLNAEPALQHLQRPVDKPNPAGEIVAVLVRQEPLLFGIRRIHADRRSGGKRNKDEGVVGRRTRKSLCRVVRFGLMKRTFNLRPWALAILTQTTQPYELDLHH